MFAQISAAIAAPSITIAPPVSVLRKLRTGAARFRAQAVRPPNEMVCDPVLMNSIMDGYSASDGSVTAEAFVAYGRKG